MFEWCSETAASNYEIVMMIKVTRTSCACIDRIQIKRSRQITNMCSGRWDLIVGQEKGESTYLRKETNHNPVFGYDLKKKYPVFVQSCISIMLGLPINCYI